MSLDTEVELVPPPESEQPQEINPAPAQVTEDAERIGSRDQTEVSVKPVEEAPEEDGQVENSPSVAPRKSLLFSKPSSPSPARQEQDCSEIVTPDELATVESNEDSTEEATEEIEEEKERTLEEEEEKSLEEEKEKSLEEEKERSLEEDSEEESIEAESVPEPPKRSSKVSETPADANLSEPDDQPGPEMVEVRNEVTSTPEKDEEVVTPEERAEVVEARRLTVTLSNVNKSDDSVEVQEKETRPVRSTRTFTRAAKEAETTEGSRTSRRQTRTKTRALESSADEEAEQESRRKTRTKKKSVKEPVATAQVISEGDEEPRSRRETRSKTKNVVESSDSSKEVRGQKNSEKESEASEVEEVNSVRQTRTKTKQLSKTQSEAALTKSAASPRVRELAAAVMSPVKRTTPTRTVGYTGSPIRDRVKVFEQAMKESAGLRSSSDSEKESVSTPNRSYCTPGRKSSIARSLKKVSAARNVPVSTILSESSVEIVAPHKKGPVIRKSPPKPKENLNNSRAPAGKIVKPGRKVGASGGRGVSPATGPRSGTGSSSLMKSRSRMELIQKAGRTTPSGKLANLVTGVSSFVPQKPKGPTLEEIQSKKEEERKQKEQREVEARQRREEQLKSKAEEAKRLREERIKRVQEARQKQESKKVEEIARKEKENKEKLAVLKKREEMHKEAERKKKLEQEELQREEEERLAREEELKRMELLRKEEENRRREQMRKEEERRKLEEKKRADAKAEGERIQREKAELAKLKEREAARAAASELDSTYSKPADADSTFTKPGDSTFSKPADSTLNRTQPSEQGGSHSYDITPARHELPPQPLINEDNYGTIRHQVFQCANSHL